MQYVHYLNTLEFYCSNKPFFCIIDQEEYYLGFKLECDHIYGPNIFKWLGKNALCPLCYAALYRDTSPFTDYIYYGELNYVMEKIVNIQIVDPSSFQLQKYSTEDTTLISNFTQQDITFDPTVDPILKPCCV